MGNSYTGGLEFKSFDVNPRLNPAQFRSSSNRVAAFAMAQPDEIVTGGRNWYPAVHEATRKGAKDLGISTHHAAGIVAAVSPNMEWEGRNIHALADLGSMGPEHWDMVRKSAFSSGGRHPEVKAMLSEVAPTLKHASDPHLLDAHRILQGESYHDVLRARTGPKRNRFAQNIERPHDPTPVTIDGRQADLIANQMRPWNWSGRNISSADLPTGKSTRYEDHEAVVRRAAQIVEREDPGRFRGAVPSEIQAVTWEGGKAFERSGTTKTGAPRKQGPSRTGQKYMAGGGLDAPQPRRAR